MFLNVSFVARSLEEIDEELPIASRNFSFLMSSRVGERARGAGLSSDRLGIIKARSGTEAIRHRAEIFLFSDLLAPLF